MFDIDADTFFGASDREYVAPGIEARISCVNVRTPFGHDVHPMQVSCFRTGVRDE